MAGAKVRFKAAPILNTLRLMRKRMGEAAYGRFVAGLPDGTRRVCTGGILPIDWVDPADWMPFHEKLLSEYCEGDEQAYRLLLNDVWVADVNGVYRAMLRVFVSPLTAVSRASQILNTYVEGSSVTVLDKQDKQFRLRFEMPGVPPIAFVITQSFIESVLRMSGAQDAEVRREVSGDRCTYSVRYR